MPGRDPRLPQGQRRRVRRSAGTRKQQQLGAVRIISCSNQTQTLLEQRHRIRLEIVFPVKVSNQSRLNRFPSQQFSRSPAGGRIFHRREVREPAKVAGCLRWRLADDRHVQADRLRQQCPHALFYNSVIPRSRRTLLQRQPVQMSSIEPMHCGPAVQPIPNIHGNALLTCDPDQEWNEGVITGAMDLGKGAPPTCARHGPPRNLPPLPKLLVES